MHFSNTQNRNSLIVSKLRFSFFKHIFLHGSTKSSNFAPDFKICVFMKKIMLTFVLAIDNTPASTPAATKILRDGQLIFLYQGKIYNVQGQQLQ